MPNPLQANQNDPWAWQQQAQTQDPGLYGWDKGAIRPDHLAAMKGQLQQAGLWKPEFDAYLNSQDNDGNSSQTPDLSSLNGYQIGAARSSGTNRLTGLFDPSGGMVNGRTYSGHSSMTGSDYAQVAGVLAGGYGMGEGLAAQGIGTGSGLFSAGAGGGGGATTFPVSGGGAFTSTGLEAGAAGAGGGAAGAGSITGGGGLTAAGSSLYAPAGYAGAGMGAAGAGAAGLGAVGAGAAGLGAVGSGATAVASGAGSLFGGGGSSPNLGSSDWWSGPASGGGGSSPNLGTSDWWSGPATAAAKAGAQTYGGMSNGNWLQLGSGALGFLGNQQAIRAGTNASNQSNQLQRDILNQQTTQNQPLIDTRNSALGKINALLTDPSSIAKEPGYEFGRMQGQKQLDNNAAAAGNYYSGGQQKAASQYNTDYATTKLDQTYNRLAGVAGLGQVGSNNQGNALSSYGQTVGNNMTNAGNFRGSGYINGANQIGNALGGVANDWQTQQYLQNLRKGP